MDVKEGIKLESRRFIGEWHEVAESVAEEAWIPIPDFAQLGSGTTSAHSESWCDRFFTAAADPHEGDARHFFSLARGDVPDLMRHEFELLDPFAEPAGEAAVAQDTEAPQEGGPENKAPEDGLQEEEAQGKQTQEAEAPDEQAEEPKKIAAHVVETRNWAILSVDAELLELPDEERLPALKSWISVLLESPLHGYELPEEVAEGTMFSISASSHPMMLSSWHERADGGIRNGALWFLCFKRVPQLMGFSNPDLWFEEPFRNEPDGALLLAAQAEKQAVLEPFAQRNDFAGSLAKLLLGRADATSVLAEAATDEEHPRVRTHQAHAYIGLAAAAQGDEEAARASFEACLEAMHSEDPAEDELPASAISRLAELRLTPPEDEEAADEGEAETPEDEEAADEEAEHPESGGPA